MSKRSGIMLFYPFEEKRLLKWSLPVIVQPKLDGERCRVLFSGTDINLISSELNIFNSVPHIKKALFDFQLKTGNPIELDGELYTHGLNFNEIHSIAGRTKNLNPSHKDLEYHVFDIITEGLAQLDRLKLLIDISKNFPPQVKLVPSIPAESLDEIMRIYDTFVEQGYEGIIVRNINAPYIRRRSTFGMKFKPKKSDIYRIIGYKEEINKDGKPKDTLGALICTGDDGSEFSVGSGLTAEQRKLFWADRESLVEKDVLVSYQHITSGGHGVPRFPVFVTLTEREPEQTFINPLF